jgi:hypothetical protein
MLTVFQVAMPQPKKSKSSVRTPEDEPECAEELGGETFLQIHVFSPEM